MSTRVSILAALAVFVCFYLSCLHVFLGLPENFPATTSCADHDYIYILKP